MKKKAVQFEYEVYPSVKSLEKEDIILLEKARVVTETAYAPYSDFQVGAVALLANGEIVQGSNQENASYPVGLCAERVLLSAISSIYFNTQIKTIAISYHNLNGKSNRPISPCGICRQTLLEYEMRQKHPIRLIMGGMDGKVFVIPNAGMLLPLSFTGDDLK
ncbi:MAG: cytidine deaminase [Sphingobacteriia bacterium]|nr:MAG: cytidine deaminase [Sphingobacteriia bacterium]TAG31786.1 MAG: cytidine deaminase [Sphingobacteriia bacterium]TAH06691.1 MAG: cytidine deaminase [Sphingobacteriia bacterium]